MASERLAKAITVLSAIGVVIAAYLTITHYQGGEVVCVAGGGCSKVQSSQYADLLGVPVSLWGVGFYLSMLALSLHRSVWAERTLLGMGLVGALFSAYLTYLELFVIDAICQWCVASAVIATSLAVLALIRFWRDPINQ